MRLLVWFHRVPERADLMRVWELRGGPLFEQFRRDGCILPSIPITVLFAGHGVPILAGEQIRPDDILYADLSLLVDNPNLADEAFGMGIPVIVDLHFPFDRVTDIQAVEEMMAGHDKDSLMNLQARELWSDPERRRRALYILRTASAVTVGPAGYAVGIKSTFLPDIKTADDVKLFYRNFTKLVINVLPGGWFKRHWRRLIGRIPVWLYSEDVSVRTQLPADPPREGEVQTKGPMV